MCIRDRYCREWLILETRPQLLTEVQLLQECPVAWGDYRITLLDHREGEGLALRPWRQGERMGLTAVSYTHLDVYKRQVWG